MLDEITLTNLLSYGPDTPPFALGRLNVIIGANGSGKSNLIDAIDLLRQAPGTLAKAIRDAGGIRDYLWKSSHEAGFPRATVDAVFAYPEGDGARLRYVLSFTETAQRFELLDERIERPKRNLGEAKPYLYYAFQNGHPVLNVKSVVGNRFLKREDMDLDRSVMAQIRDKNEYPELTYLASALPEIQIYREWRFGRDTPARKAQDSAAPNLYLEPDCSNLGLMLNGLRRDSVGKTRAVTYLRKLYDGIDDFDVQVEGGTVQVFLHEDGITVPATRLSDGTLRYLCLLAVLCQRKMPPLLCIEEPELGLHPDILPTVAELLVQASERCQLIVTTHSDVLVDAMTEQPEAIVVCEKVDGQSRLRRLSASDLSEWLGKYRLGELWTSGELGGTRW